MLQFSVDNVHNKNHHVFFALAVSTAAVELGLTAYLLAARSHMRGPSYHTLSIIFLFDALWTVLYPSTCVLWSTKGSLDLLANLFGSVLWIFAAAIVWGLSIGSVHNARARNGCKGIPLDLNCPHYLSPSSLAWTEFVLCLVTLILAIMWVQASRTRRGKLPRFYV